MLKVKMIEFRLILCLISLSLLVFELLNAANSPNNVRTWENNLVNIEYQTLWPASKQSMIDAAIKDIEEISCVKFVKRPLNWHMHAKGRNSIVMTTGYGCLSTVGRRHHLFRRQRLSLDDGCFSDTTIKHEFFHALGFNHEQSRSDRSKYINVRVNMIQDDKKDQYEIDEKSTNYGDFDFQSIMLYSAWHFSKIPWRPVWLIRKGMKKDYEVLLRGGGAGSISWQDAKGLNQLYKCNKDCPNKNSCPKDTYMDKKCKCISPEAFAKDQCKDKATDCAKRIGECYSSGYKSVRANMASVCRKTCGFCYKSPTGPEYRGRIKVCEDFDVNPGFCSRLKLYRESTIKLNCKNQAGRRYFCPKTCSKKCYMTRRVIVKDQCRNHAPKPLCEDYVESKLCNSQFGKEYCARKCKLCK